MIRRWRVQPDLEEETADGVVYAVSQEALAVATMDAVTMAHRAGGTFSVVLERFPTGLPGEMITTGAVVEWRDRTDARPQPEKQNAHPVVAALDDGADIRVETGTLEPPPEDDPTQYHGGELDPVGDGLDPNALPEEDDSSVEERV